MAATQIKLFGKTILFPETIKTHCDSSDSYDFGMKKKRSLSFEYNHCSSSVSDQDTENIEESIFTNESGNPKTPSFETEPDLQNYSKNEQSESNSENTQKKPEKALPCPRCESADTKFCYYNNYNLTQPRHFCKNCQRYWTSGGTMRNVPVGSGRRKNKNTFDSHYQAYGKLLDFVSNAHTKPSEPFAWNPNFDQKSQKYYGNGFLVSDDRSSITSSGSVEYEGKNNSVIQETNIQNHQNFPPIMFYGSPGFTSFPCFYPPKCDNHILGKHSREKEMFSNIYENNLFYPKTSRINDRNESGKGSIWSSLGVKNEKIDIMKANPAALARSLNFHEIV